METLWEYRYAHRVKSMKSSFIREILKLTQKPDVISFAGGLPAPKVFPVKNFQEGVFRGADRINEDTLVPLFDRNRACFNCPIHCTKISSIKGGRYRGCYTEGPEYENTWAFGANCDNVEIGAIVQAEYLCDLYGMDANAILRLLPDEFDEWRKKGRFSLRRRTTSA